MARKQEHDDMKHDLVQAYDDYLVHKDKEHAKFREEAYKGGSNFTASSAGMCIKKHWYAINDTPRIPLDAAKLKIFRLGSVMDEDFKFSTRHYIKNHSESLLVYEDVHLVHKQLRIQGMMDCLIVDENRKGYLFDYKTMKTFAYRRKFGRDAHKFEQSKGYELQLGTYALLINNSDLCDEVVEMGLVYYNKDDSRMKQIPVDMKYVEEARNYWKNVNMYVNFDSHLFEENAVFNLGEYPVMAWECKGYCPYEDVCESPYKKK